MGYSARHYDVLNNDTYLQMVTDLRRARIHAGLSQTEVAARVGVQWSTLSGWERRVAIPSMFHLLGWWDVLNFEPAQRIGS